MATDRILIVEQKLLGRGCIVEKQEFAWTLTFDDGSSAHLPVPWRIVDHGRIALADQDHGQRFGLPAPLDGEAEANRLLRGKRVTALSIDPETADLSISFGPSTRLDAFNASAGHEGWQIRLSLDQGGISVIALGGGEIAMY